ncbi:MAG: fumarylacetoacetate hydrolase family protein [Spirochaetaceae bacterium]|jgi:2-keto-4-pentenoate hydratase/2-oxohepta-3-ene-1,7-dioic acid hydratase in catechol pathway|nr:fumarylacetoacetate hydrolase family protein [Spirochaetaceae bacterium]
MKINLPAVKVIGVGLNYRDHVKEGFSNGKALKIPKEPVLFVKTPNTLIGPDEPIILPKILKSYGFETPRTDIEAELAVLIGKPGRNIPAEQAFEYVSGYACFNDVSQRNIQTSDVSGWFRGKCFDTFGPIGPVISRIPNPQNLAICSRINGAVKQSGNTRDMIFSIPELIAFISRNFTLEKGDIIATGTPAGVSPIQPGDIVEVEIEGLGILRNPVQEEL